MANEFRLPDIGEGLTEAEIVRWLVDEGDEVKADQPIVEVETDKAVVEIPSPYAGIVLRHGGAAGDVIEVGSVLVVIGDPVESLTDIDESVAPGAAESMASPSIGAVGLTSPGAKAVAPIVGTLSEEAEVLGPRSEKVPAESGSVKALPIVRKLARDNDIDLAAITGSGPDGRITREDVQAAIESRESSDTDETPQTEPSSTQSPARPSGGEDDRQTMSRLRRTIAQNMSRSWAEIPHVTTFDDVDATRLLETRSALARRHGVKLPLEALIVKAVLPALAEYPEFNSSIEGDDLVIHRSHDIGIAVDTDEGLMVAVIHDADTKSVLDLGGEVVRLGEGARARKLGPDELTGQTFTVSNIGAVGGGHGTPIIPFGTIAILSVGRAREKAIVFEGDLVIAPVMPLSLSYDHRVIDGAKGRRFMSLVMENLEEPALFLAE